MDGGAWNSEVFDNGRDFQKTRAATGVPVGSGVESGAAPAMYNPSPSVVGKDSRMFGVLIVTLRSALVVFSLIGFSVMAADKETVYGTYYDLIAKFNNVQAFVGLLSLDVIVCFYSIVQLVLCVVQVLSTGTFVSSAAAGGSLLTFIFDSVLAYALIAAAAAAATAQAHVQAANYCENAGGFSGFCRKAQASIVLSFFAFTILAACAALYPIRLLRMSK